MQKILRHTLIATLAAASLGAWAQSPSRLKVEDAWVRGTVAQQKATGAFMRLTAERELRLLSARSPVAGVVEIHEMALNDGIMRMRAVPGLALPAGKTVELKPGGYHVMLLDLKAPVSAGQQVPLTLLLEGQDGRREQVELQLPVRALNAQTMGQGHQQHPSGGHMH